MAYTQKTWEKDELIEASDLNNIEEGIKGNENDISTLEENISGLQNDINSFVLEVEDGVLILKIPS